MTFELFTDDAPQTVENFRCLCTGEKGLGESGLPLHYLNNIFHRVVKGFMAQGGDITREDGSGGESIYGAHIQEEPAAFAAHSHDARGLLSMANAGPGTEASQFFVLFAEAPWLDGRHVVFGKLIDGEGVLASIEECGTPSGKPSRCIRIAACGQLQNEPTEAAEDGSGGDETADAAEGAQQDGQHAVNTADEEPQGEGKEDAAADAADGEPQEEEAGDNPP
ncbi:putative cyclophilin [Tribonema minus]|uniref:Peptidyl-prolyl cis-trans isomerase n=1 Tax=Tribonema minus TaxID=303371 RepID=A0A835YXK6_9STRA|nr:putative cyclophilin [Tribonema minus]